MVDGEFETEPDAHRERVERPVWRLFGAYTADHDAWLPVGYHTRVGGRGTHEDLRAAGGLCASLRGVQAGAIESPPG